ncbi:MAG TPA: type 1 glutamine amidotransferase domain-containing protein [Polyangiaceae bacterium]|nr:type 1 glutamine amidotransferase domain-containing protein [Polyangiaceae bacterium]
MNATQGRLSGKRIAVLAADGFEYLELTGPRKALEAAGGQVDVVSLHPGRIRGMNLTQPTRTVRVDRELGQADADDYDALFVPGGFVGPDLLRQSRLARSFVRAFDIANKPIASLCHGPWLLVSAGLVEGRLVAAWPGIRDDVVHAGGIWRDEPVVRDRNWVTSRGPQDLHAFVPAMKELFAATAGSLALDHAAGNGNTHDDVASSPSRDEPPTLAVAGARLLPGPTLRTLTFAAVGTALGAYAYRRAAAR